MVIISILVLAMAIGFFVLSYFTFKLGAIELGMACILSGSVIGFAHTEIIVDRSEPVEIPIVSSHILPDKLVIYYDNPNKEGETFSFEVEEILKYNNFDKETSKLQWTEKLNLYGNSVGNEYELIVK